MCLDGFGDTGEGMDVSGGAHVQPFLFLHLPNAARLGLHDGFEFFLHLGQSGPRTETSPGACNRLTSTTGIAKFLSHLNLDNW